MGESFQFIDIVLFALVAGFLILRLRSVLGRRDGHQGRAPDPFTPQPKAEPANEKVVHLPDRGDRPVDPVTATKVEGLLAPDVAKSPLEIGLTQIAIADSAFDPDGFLSGARIAFELVLNAFAAADSEALKPLLSPEVYGNFVESIQQRQAAGQRLETKLVGIKSSELVEAYMAGRTAHVTVGFVSQQISAVYDAGGKVVEGDPAEVIEVTDTWTFARDTRSSDPNWALVATGATD
jgi:predicted lipid-binding transport protein (Tim44 family)